MVTHRLKLSNVNLYFVSSIHGQLLVSTNSDCASWIWNSSTQLWRQVPWKLLKKPSLGTHKRVYVCPELSCLHHDPSHALGDLVGIKKHYRRKHCIEKQWKCDRCSKGYAVQSDYKAHLKTCGTRGHCCDCGRVFSRCELPNLHVHRLYLRQQEK